MRAPIAIAASALLVATIAAGQEVAPFKGGFPTPEEAQKARDHADYQRAITADRFWYPTVSCEALFNGNRALGIKDNEAMILLSAGPRHVVFTANSDRFRGGEVTASPPSPPRRQAITGLFRTRGSCEW